MLDWSTTSIALLRNWRLVALGAGNGAWSPARRTGRGLRAWDATPRAFALMRSPVRRPFVFSDTAPANSSASVQASTRSVGPARSSAPHQFEGPRMANLP